MNRRGFIVLLGSAAITPFSARAEPAASTMAAQLVGTWRFVSSVNTRGDGTTFDRWGNSPRGTFMFDADGRFAFGTYSVDEANKTIITRIEGSSISKLNGATQHRVVTALTKDELKYINPVTGAGTQVESMWQRATAATQ